MTSDTHEVAASLRTLHRIHRQLSDLNGRLARGPRLAKAHDAAVAKLQAAHDAIKQEHLDQRMAVDEKQLRLGSHEEMVKKRQGQLTQANDNREYQALKDQIAANEMANSVLADEILEGMEKSDELAEKVAEAEKVLAKRTGDSEKAKAEIAAEQPLIQGDVTRLQGELKQVEETLPADFKEPYDRLVRKRGEDSLAIIEGMYCSGCNQQIPLNQINDVMLGKPLVCQGCGRLLYLPEGYDI